LIPSSRSAIIAKHGWRPDMRNSTCRRHPKSCLRLGARISARWVSKRTSLGSESRDPVIKFRGAKVGSRFWPWFSSSGAVRRVLAFRGQAQGLGQNAAPLHYSRASWIATARGHFTDLGGGDFFSCFLACITAVVAACFFMGRMAAALVWRGACGESTRIRPCCSYRVALTPPAFMTLLGRTFRNLCLIGTIARFGFVIRYIWSAPPLRLYCARKAFDATGPGDFLFGMSE